MRTRLALAVVGALVVAVAAAAQPSLPQGQARPGAAAAGPARDTPPPPATGTGRIAGRVLSSDGKPLRKALVRLVGRTGAGGGPADAAFPAQPFMRSATSDPAGLYEFSDLPAGQYTVSATKSGYVSVGYGAAPDGTTAPVRVDVADGARVEKIDIVMPRGCVITGRVFDEFGEPAMDISVSVVREQSMAGRKRMSPAGASRPSDDLGQYRLFGLSPGDYYVSATARPNFFDYGSPSAPPDRTGYAPTYYPGTPTSAEARKLHCQSGAELGGIDFGLVPVRTVQISGRVLDAQGRPAANAYPSLRSISNPFGGGTFPTSNTKPDGSFVIGNVTPGEYQLTAMTGGGPMNQTREFASLPVTVGGSDISGLILQLSRGGRLSGRIVADAGLALDVPLSKVGLATRSADPDAVSFSGGGQPKIQDDGTFELTGLFGSLLLRAYGTGTWQLKAVRIDGQDRTDSPIEFKGGEDVTGVEVVLTNRFPTLTGSVTDNRGAPVKDVMVIAFAEDSARWRYPSRFVGLGRPDGSTAQFKITSLPPGDYLAVAVPFASRVDYQDPDVLEGLRKGAARVTLGEGETKSLTLKVTQAAARN